MSETFEPQETPEEPRRTGINVFLHAIVEGFAAVGFSGSPEGMPPRYYSEQKPRDEK